MVRKYKWKTEHLYTHPSTALLHCH